MRISDWSSDVCSSDLGGFRIEPFVVHGDELASWADVEISQSLQDGYLPIPGVAWKHPDFGLHVTAFAHGDAEQAQLVARYRLENTTDRPRAYRSEEHTSELQSLMRISYAVFCLQKQHIHH